MRTNIKLPWAKLSRGSSTLQTRGASHYMALPFTFKSITRQKKELWKLKYFTMQKYNLQKKSSKRKTKILQNIFNSIITNLKFQTQAKISSFKKSSYKNK
jgi:hypothetical protein